jgi:hypothetical protein
VTGLLFVKKTEAIDNQCIPKILKTRIFAHEEHFFWNVGLLVPPKFRILFTKGDNSFWDLNICKRQTPGYSSRATLEPFLLAISYV